MFISIGRVLKFAMQDLWRNFWLSFATITLLVITFISFNILLSLNYLAKKVTQNIENRIDVSIYFTPEATDEQVSGVKTFLESLTGVASVQLVSREEAIQQFRERHKDDAEILSSLDELDKNPLGATVIVKAKTINDYGTILSAIDSEPYKDLIQDKNFADHRVLIERLGRWTDKIRNAAMILSLIFIIIVVMIVFNTVRMAIYTHREEIGIMKLVGASNWFVRAPYILESVILAVISVGIAITLTYLMTEFSRVALTQFFEDPSINLTAYFNANFFKIFGLELALMVCLTALGSFTAMGRYLKK
jgi:cell division transport system permease protein